MGFEFNITARGYELDSFGHVNNSVYLNWMEEARWQILREFELFDYFTVNNLLLVVIENYIKYIREVKIFDELIIKTNVEHISPYLIFDQKIYNKIDNLIAAKGYSRTLLIDKDRTPCDIPEIIIQKIEANKNE